MDQALGGIIYSPTPVVAAQAFDLGRPVSELLPVRCGDTDTWRLDTVKGSYLIKGYWPTTGGQFTDGQLPDQLEVAMAFERRALEAGVDMAAPIPPTDPLVGWVTRINERLFRAYRWIEHRELRPDDDIADWLGRTMAQIHQLEPLSQVGLPDWWRAAIWPRVTWEEWFAEAQRRNKSWSDLAHERLPDILEISARIEALCEVAPDSVMTHGDFKTHNMLKTPTGQVLVDWDSVRVDSAALEAGRVAFIFGAGKLEPIRRILRAYAAAGGDITWSGRDLFLSVARHHLQGLFERILVSLEQIPAPRWMEDSRAIEQSIGELLRELPDKIDHLASKTSDLGGRD
jgi:hypothetical protein